MGEGGGREPDRGPRVRALLGAVREDGYFVNREKSLRGHLIFFEKNFFLALYIEGGIKGGVRQAPLIGLLTWPGPCW